MRLEVSKTQVREVDSTEGITALIYKSSEQYVYMEGILKKYGITPIFAKKTNIKELIANLNYDIAVLDHFDGDKDMSLIRLLRKIDKKNRPVIFSTPQWNFDAEYGALINGADVFYPQPYNLDCFAMMLKNFAKRVVKQVQFQEAQDYIIGNCTLSAEHSCVLYPPDDVIHLTAIELSIMRLLFVSSNPSHFVPRDQILDSIWQDTSSEKVRLLQVYISGLRKKLEITPIRIKSSSQPKGYSITYSAE